MNKLGWASKVAIMGFTRDNKTVDRVCLAHWAGDGALRGRGHDHGQYVLGYGRERREVLVAGSDHGGEHEHSFGGDGR